MMIDDLARLSALLTEAQLLLTKLTEEAAGGPVKGAIETTIIPLVCQEFGISSEAFFGRCRTGRVSWARHAAVGLIMEHSDYSYSELGRILKKHHGTIMNNVAQFKMGDGKFQQKVNFVRSKLKGLGIP